MWKHVRFMNQINWLVVLEFLGLFSNNKNPVKPYYGHSICVLVCLPASMYVCMSAEVESSKELKQ